MFEFCSRGFTNAFSKRETGFRWRAKLFELNFFINLLYGQTSLTKIIVTSVNWAGLYLSRQHLGKQQKLRDKRTNQNAGLEEVQDFSSNLPVGQPLMKPIIYTTRNFLLCYWMLDVITGIFPIPDSTPREIVTYMNIMK